MCGGLIILGSAKPYVCCALHCCRRPRRPSFTGMNPFNTIISTVAAYQAQLRPILQEYCAALDLEGCFDGLSASEAHQTAVNIIVAICGRDDPADHLRQRADEMVANALAISRSLRIAAAVW